MTTLAGPAALASRELGILLAACGVVVVAGYLVAFGGHAGGGHGGHGALAAPGGAPLPSYLALAAMWFSMMVAMMLPPVLPWIWFFAAMSRRAEDGSLGWGTVGVFSSGYFAVWGSFSLLAAGVEVRLMRSGLLDGGAQTLVIPAISGALLILAGVYQFTSLKSACLRHCRSPLSYFLARWRDGPAGAFSMGARHGFFCLGCCWALMLLSFALGVMNFVWMIVLTLFLCVEKIAPGGDRYGHAFGGMLIVWGLLLLAKAML